MSLKISIHEAAEIELIDKEDFHDAPPETGQTVTFRKNNQTGNPNSRADRACDISSVTNRVSFCC
jgi:hypothetical protein